jgi:cell division protein ZapA
VDQILAPTAPAQAQQAAADIEVPSVSVEIYDQIYHLRGVDPSYIEHLADAVDGKMRAVSAHGGTVDSLRVAVLAALNIADELSTLQQRYDSLLGQQQTTQRSLRHRADSLSGMLDEVLTERRVG